MSFLVTFATPALADYGLEETATAAGIQTSKSITTVLGDVVGTGLSLVSVLFFGLMLYAGIRWMLARGNEDEAHKALDTIIAAAIGLVIVLGSYALTNFVFKSVGTGSAGGGGVKPAPAAPQAPTKLPCEDEYPALGCYVKTECDETQGTKDELDAYVSTVGKGTYVKGNSFISGLCGAGPKVCCSKK